MRFKQSRVYYHVAVHYAALGDVARCEAAVQCARLVMDQGDLSKGEFECQLVAVLVRCGSVPSARARGEFPQTRDAHPRHRTYRRDRRRHGRSEDGCGVLAHHRKLLAPLWEAQPEPRRRVLQRDYDLAVALEMGDVDAALQVVERMADTKDPKAGQRRPGPPQGPPEFPNAKSHGLGEVVHHLVCRRAAAGGGAAAAHLR